MSSRSVPTTLIGPKGLLRDSLASLLGGYSYRVSESLLHAADMQPPPSEEDRRLVVLMLATMEQAVTEALRVKQVAPSCKVVALLEELPGADIQKLANSAIDGCLPLQVSSEALTGTLDLVMADATRVVVLPEDPRLPTSHAADRHQTGSSGGAGGDASSGGSRSSTTGDVDEPTLVPKSTMPGQTATALVPAKASPAVSRQVNGLSLPLISIASDAAPPCENGPGNTRRLNRHIARFDRRAGIDGFDGETAVPPLSERERQIIDGLVKGQPNKTIARVCGITEATVKVHMKAILRKVPCSNRTQVAIWALDHPDLFRPGLDGARIEAPRPGMAE
jgi:two-component system nitrate/nitrite response regulator NarL